eukprot:1583317-Amphidinium_carterae.1
MIAEAKQLCQHTANERHELLSSCQRVNLMLGKPMLNELSKGNFTPRGRKWCEIEAQSDVLMGQARTEFEKVQHELDELRAQVQSAERERDTSMSQLAGKHAAINGACQDIHWSANREPGGFSTFVDQVWTNEDSGIHLVPPFASQQ